ncbi:MAG: MBOAT family protein [Acetatifactor sp.]|nr:MBOAT family protein [Acetatifactor sp.]
MVFSSIEFLLCFLPVFLLLYSITPKPYKNMTLLSGSLVFYAMGALTFLPLLILSVVGNFLLGRRFAVLPVGNGKQGRQKRLKVAKMNKKLLGAAVVGNIGVLALFKVGFGEAGLPLGISFYTFQVLSYHFDVYRGEQKKETSFVRFATYICMFPQLVSGPIVAYGEVRKELHKREFTAQGLQQGLKVFTVGLAAKVLLADRIGILWHEVQVTGFESISTPLAWLAAVAYSLKIYFDFYGYSLMAVGLGRMFGFELPDNFRDPYMAGSLRDFYRRWHVTLGRWFCKYVYIPLGGSQRGMLRTVCNLLAVWLLTSVWHGTTGNFLIWGMLIFLLIVLERQFESWGFARLFRRGILKAVPHLYLWLAVPVTWMCFAITDLSQLYVYLGRMFGVVEGIYVSAGDWTRALEAYWYLFGIGILACMPFLKKLFYRWKDSLVGTLLLAVLFWFCVWRLQIQGQNPFMYSNF